MVAIEQVAIKKELMPKRVPFANAFFSINFVSSRLNRIILYWKSPGAWFAFLATEAIFWEDEFLGDFEKLYFTLKAGWWW